MKPFHSLAAFVLLVCATTLQAEDYTHQASGLSFRLPKGWTCTEKANRLTITNKDKTVTCVGDVIPEESAKAIFADITKFIDNLDGWDDVEVTDGPTKEKVHGLEQTWYEGTASFQDKKGEAEELEWDMTIVTGGKAILFLIGIGKLDENETAYEKFFESIKRASVTE